MKNPCPDRYRQDGPRDEMVQLISAAYGQLFLLQLGPENRQEIVARTSQLLNEALVLVRGMPEDKWS